MIYDYGYPIRRDARRPGAAMPDPGDNSPEAWAARAESAETPWTAAGWSERGQKVRHVIVRQRLAPMFNRGLTVLDYGCNVGALADHFSEMSYIGYDSSHGAIVRARMLRPDHDFTTTEPRGEYDLTAVVGTFNLHDRWSERQTWAKVAELWGRTRRAMAVSLYQGEDERCIRYRPSVVAANGARLAHDFSVERGYLPNDLLLVLRR